MNPTITVVAKNTNQNAKLRTNKSVELRNRNKDVNNVLKTSDRIIRNPDRAIQQQATRMGSVGAVIGSALLVKNIAVKGLNIYYDIMEAKTGDTMRYYNERVRLRRMFTPISNLVSDTYKYGIIEPMQIARQNKSLENSRVLTGNVINTQNNQKGVF